MARTLPPGVYDDLIDRGLAEAIDAAEGGMDIEHGDIDPADAPMYVARHLRKVVERVLGAFRGEDDERSRLRAELTAALLRTLADKGGDSDGALDRGELEIPTPPRRLLSVAKADPVAGGTHRERPELSLSQSALLVNAPDEPALGSELCRELASADSVDLLCAFVKWSGLRFVRDRLAEVAARGGRIRVITTTYTGATDARAVDELVKLGAEVKVSYDTRRTRLHAKAWLFQRNSGTNTAYIGSSNLSGAALHEGLEWNVRLAEADSAPLLRKFRAAFESYWASEEFVAYDPERDRERLDSALVGERPDDGLPTNLVAFDLRPHPYQEQILEALEVERERGHHRNLVVAPTGTGKTLVAAFDYKRLRQQLASARLLFVAHRDRILTQSQVIFRQVLKEGSFGELWGNGQRPTHGAHVFATIQTLANTDLDSLPPDRFDVVVVDEFHHAEAPTYERLLKHLTPKVLLGLTATPERHDGRDVRRWFDGRTAYEMRLWDALEQGLLCPFHYFATNDQVDLSDVAWRRTGYDQAELEKLYTGNEARVRLVLNELERRVHDVRRMRALGFCVSVAHAEYMAKCFAREGLAAVAVTGDTASADREKAVHDLVAGKMQALFTVDLFNEGVDIPQIDTVLFLRPTESATVFMQQLGRGLRLLETKPCLTVLDFIGNARREFRYDRRFRALLGGSTKQVARQVEEGFPFLPPGCAMYLDRVATQRVLENIRRSVGSGSRWLSEELRALGPDTSLATFLAEAGVDLQELYAGRRSFTSLRATAFSQPPPEDETARTLARLGSLLHVDDPERLSMLRALTSATALPPVTELSERQRRLLFMLLAVLDNATAWGDLGAAMEGARASAAFCSETRELVEVLEDALRQQTLEWQAGDRIRQVPLRIHAHYRQEEVLAAFRKVTPKGIVLRLQAGVCFVPEENVDLLFVTLRKTESTFSPSTMYKDYAISPSRFHWESQNSAHPESEAGKRYIEGSSKVLLFVRESQKQANGLADPYLFAGPARLVEWSGARPMSIVWELERPLPAVLYHHATLAAG